VNHLLLGISAGLGACVVLLLAVLAALVRRTGRVTDERVSSVMRGLQERMDDLGRELAAAVARADEEGRQSRFLGEIAGTVDLDEVLARTLQAATGAVPDADAALVRLENQEGGPTIAAHGLSADGVESVAGPPDGSRARAIEVSYLYGDDGEDRERQIHGGLAVPLEEAGGRIGYLTVFTRAADRRFDESDVQRLEGLALRAGPSIENARRFRELRQLADLDALTGLHNRRYFHETLARECARAHRYSRRLALLVFDLDDFKDVNDQIGHLAGDAVLAEAAARVREVVRTADIPCRVGGDEFAVVLPESGIEQADQLFARIQSAITGKPIGKAGRLSISAGVAELQPEDDSIFFFERADEALYRAKEAGKGRAVAANGTTS
jgi:diguanylate cyclase (GGDEF)-like protein